MEKCKKCGKSTKKYRMQLVDDKLIKVCDECFENSEEKINSEEEKITFNKKKPRIKLCLTNY